MPKNWLNYLGLIFLAIVLFSSGFYFGFKNSSAKQSESQVEKNIAETKSDSVTELIKAKDVDGVFWIKPGQEPICPKEYSIKGTFNDSGGNFYTKTNPRYDRIKPDICFATEDFARDKTGFIKKF